MNKHDTTEQDQLETANWLKSSLCASNACVEVAAIGSTLVIRDSKNPSGGTLVFTKEEWKAFTGGVSQGEFDLDKLGA